MRQTLDQWQSYLESLDPTRIELGLERAKTVLKRLQLSISSKIIIVGGTNGKGSTVAALQALLLSEGKTLGSYVSPHLQVFNERICYQGQPVTDDELIHAFERVEHARESTALTYFEFTTLAAIQLLVEKKPDYLIFEVGLGGRLDAVNILDADIAIITGVAMDHTDWLGNDLETIGYEKAGIYRADKPAVYASENCPDRVFQQIARLGARPYILGDQLSIETSVDNMMNGTAGKAFVLNLQLADQSFAIDLHNQSLPTASIVAALTAYVLLGFEAVDSVSSLLSEVSIKGRYQSLVYEGTQCILDVAHNEQAASCLAQRLSEDQDIIEPVAIVGTMADKSLRDIFEPMRHVIRQWFLVQPGTPRASSLEQQRQALVDLGVDDDKILDIGAISEASMKNCLNKTETAVIFGSFYTVGEFLDLVDLKNS